MKMLKIGIAAASLLLASAQTLAMPIPTYHVADGFTGTATIQSSGGCKSKVIYQNASLGTILDSGDVEIGFGLVSEAGNILSLENDGSLISSINDNVTGESTASIFEDMASSETIDTVATNSACSIDTMVANPNSKMVIKSKGATASISLKFNFSGYITDVSSVKGNKTIRTGKKYSGTVTFKYSSPAIT